MGQGRQPDRATLHSPTTQYLLSNHLCPDTGSPNLPLKPGKAWQLREQITAGQPGIGRAPCMRSLQKADQALLPGVGRGRAGGGL